MPNDAIVVMTTAGNVDQAETLARSLVGERLAACVNIVPGVRSVFRWKTQVQQDHECILLVKTVASRFEEVRRRIRELHSYELPEVIAVPIAHGDPDVLRWIAESVDVRPA